MKTILQYIKENPIAFIGAAEERSHTTPSHANMLYHQALMTYIHSENWKMVEELITDANYYRPLEGVILVADGYGLDYDDVIDAYDAYQSGYIV